MEVVHWQDCEDKIIDKFPRLAGSLSVLHLQCIRRGRNALGEAMDRLTDYLA